jgi:hypothetical protein
VICRSQEVICRSQELVAAPQIVPALAKLASRLRTHGALLIHGTLIVRPPVLAPHIMQIRAAPHSAMCRSSRTRRPK